MISIIIPTHQTNTELLGITFASIASQIYENYEVIVVENPNITEEVAKCIEDSDLDLNKVTHIDSAVGANASRNAGVEKSVGDLLFFTTDDTILTNTLLMKYDAAHKLYSGGIIGGPVNIRYVNGKPRWMHKEFEKCFNRIDHGTPFGMCPFEVHQETELDIPLSCLNMSVKKKAFNTMGRFNPQAGLKGCSLLTPNDELSLILKTKSYNPRMIYIPDAYVTHSVLKEHACENYVVRKMYGKGVADFNSLMDSHPNLSRLEVYEKILIEYTSMTMNDSASFYCLFSGMKRVERLYATKTYHKAKTEYVSGLLSQVQI